MRIVGMAMVKNEADIIEAFVRHNLRFLDGVVVLDNASVDGTRGILMELMREGLPVVITDDSEVAFTKWEKTTDLLSRIVPVFRPDWVIPLDADEMIACTTRDAFETVLAAVPEGSVPALPWKTYVPTTRDEAGEVDPLRRIRHRRVVERPQWVKVALPRREYTRHRLIIAQGQHSVRRDGENGPIPAVTTAGAALAHFPIRSVEQILGKVIVGWLAYLSDPERVEGCGEHWQSMYERFLEASPTTGEDLYHLALTYAGSDGSGGVLKDPLRMGPTPTLRYTEMRTGSPLVKVARTAEQIARQTGRKGVAPADAGALPRALVGRPQASHLSRMDCDIPPFLYVFERFRPRSVLGIGCGMHPHLKRFSEWGVDTMGVEPHGPGPDSHSPGGLHVHSLEPLLGLERHFDVVACVDVSDRLPPAFENLVLDSMARRAGKVIVFCAARPGQPGIGHVNLTPTSHWAREWEARGWRVLPFASIAFRLLANDSWLQRNALILVRQGQVSELEPGCGSRTTDWSRPELDGTEWRDQKPGA